MPGCFCAQSAIASYLPDRFSEGQLSSNAAEAARFDLAPTSATWWISLRIASHVLEPGQTGFGRFLPAGGFRLPVVPLGS